MSQHPQPVPDDPTASTPEIQASSEHLTTIPSHLMNVRPDILIIRGLRMTITGHPIDVTKLVQSIAPSIRFTSDSDPVITEH